VYRASEQNLYNSYVIASRVLSNVLRLNSGCSVTLPTISFHSSLYVDCHFIFTNATSPAKVLTK